MPRFFAAFVFIWHLRPPFWHIKSVDVIIIFAMSEFLVPSPDSSRNQFPNFTKEFGVPLDVYIGRFTDGDTETRVIVDTTDRPRIEEGELYSDPLHEVSVFEITDSDAKRRVTSPDAGRYPFSERVEAGKFRLPLIRLFGADQNIVILQGPNWRTDNE
jgi:hypothetical protein